MKTSSHLARRFRTALRSFLIAGVLCFGGIALTAQIRVSGKLLEKETKTAIPFANIGIENTAVGSLSNADGSFSIEIPETFENRELLFSALGYQPKYFKVSKLAGSKYIQVYLDSKVLELDPITLVPEKAVKRKSVTLGNGKSLLLSGQLAYDSIYAGSAMALRINKKKYPDLPYLQNVSLFIAGNKSPEFKVRLRLMALDQQNGGAPGKDLVEDQIIEYSSMRKGWLKFELPRVYHMDQDIFFVVFEWIMEKKDRQFIADTYETYLRQYPDRVVYDTLQIEGKEVVDIQIGKILAGTLFGTTNSKSDLENHPTYYRNNSFGSWVRSGSALSAKVEIGN